jgi:hypothetical protein
MSLDTVKSGIARTYLILDSNLGIGRQKVKLIINGARVIDRRDKKNPKRCVTGHKEKLNRSNISYSKYELGAGR